ncbi:MAG: hypothetical protein AB7Q23_08185 [Hyphomonadaceae bacterium]
MLSDDWSQWLLYGASWCLLLLFGQAFKYSAFGGGLRGPAQFSLLPLWFRMLLALLNWCVLAAVISLCVAPFLLTTFGWACASLAIGWIIGSAFSGLVTAAMQRGWPLRQDFIGDVFFPAAPYLALAALASAVGVWILVATQQGWLAI